MIFLFLFLILSVKSFAYINGQDAAIRYMTTAKQSSIDSSISTANAINATSITNISNAAYINTEKQAVIDSTITTANLFSGDRVGNVFLLKTNPTSKIFAVNATSTPNLETGTSYMDIRTYIKGELRIDPTSNSTPYGAKISFGSQKNGPLIRDAYIERLVTTSATAELNIHSYTRMFLTTGINKNNIGQYRKNATRTGVFINNFSTTNVLSSGQQPATSAKPLTFNKPVNRDNYAVTMEHVEDDDMSGKPLNGVLRVSMISKDGSNLGRDYISFTDSQEQLVGSIGGHEATVMGIAQSGIKLESIGADYAEYLEKIDPLETITPGDIVGVYSGKITRKTRGADAVMVVSTMPLVIGNKKSSDNMLPVVFIGQAPVRVRGEVRHGQYIVASGLGDGVGVATNRILATIFRKKIIGQAWSESIEDRIKYINVMVSQ